MRVQSLKTLLFSAILLTWAGSLAHAADDDAQWKALFNCLPQTQSVEATFEEWRYSLLRDRPSYLQGVLRFDQKIGVSLSYLKPSERTIIIDENSVSLRNPEGETRTLPDNERYNWIPYLIGTIFSFDLESWKGGFILKDYSVEGENWSAVIEPKQDTGRDRIREVTMTGDAVYVTAMEMRMKGGKRVKIEVASAEKNISFSEEAVKRYF